MCENERKCGRHKYSSGRKGKRFVLQRIMPSNFFFINLCKYKIILKLFIVNSNFVCIATMALAIL